MALARELAIKSLYIFHHINNISVKRIGVYPEERKKALLSIIKNNKTKTSEQDVEQEIYNIMVKYFVR